MPLAIQYQTLPLNGSWSYTFNFPDSVYSYVVGIPYFYLTYPTTFREVQQLGLNIETLAQLVSAQEGTQIPVTVNATLSDAGGDMIDLTNSSVVVAVIAWTGSDPDVMVGSATVDNGQSQPITVPDDTPVSGLLPILSGFDLEYSDTSYEVESLEVGISASPQSQGVVTLGGTASMRDAGGHSADGSGGSTATITGSLLATSLSSPGFVKQSLLAQQSSQPVSVPFDSQVVQAVPLITGFKMQYSGPTSHYVSSVSAGAKDWSINGSIVVLTSGAQALLSDTVNNQDNTASNVSLVVIGIPSS